MYAIINATTYDFNQYKENQYILFENKIIETGNMQDYVKQSLKEIDAKNNLVMPGLINGHSHIYSTFARGLNVPFHPHNFEELLEQLWWKLDRNLTNETTYYSGIVSGIEYLKNGVTTIIDHHASGEVIGSLSSLKKAVCDDVQLRGIFCFETSDRFDVNQCIDENKTFIATNNDSKVKGLFGGHAAFTLSDDTLKKIGKIIGDTPLHIHVAESKLDQDLSIKRYHKRVVERLNDYSLINRNYLLVHGLYLTDKELDIIKSKEAVIALNVTSNMNNAVGLPNYYKMKEKDIKVIIGNDGISMNMTSEYKMLFYAMHHLAKTPTLFGFDDLLTIINNTYEYASDLLNIRLGRIEKGYESDLLILEYQQPTNMNKDNIFGHLFFGLFNDFKPKEVFVNGKHILNNYKVSEELESKYNESEKYATILWNKIEKEGTK